MSASNLLAYCRGGFEGECARELVHAMHGTPGFVRAKPASAYALFQPDDAEAGARAAQSVDFAALVFARQLVRCGALLDLPIGDRALAIASAARGLGAGFAEVRIETPDTNEGKALAALTRTLAPHLRKALAAAGVAFDAADAVESLHLFFVSGTGCHVGVSRRGNASPWPMGIPRLRMPRDAPSRSTLKLAEAILVFLGPAGERLALAPGMTAVDLGAAPGGWTWQLVRRGLMVTAVDNAAIAPALLETGQVRHRREDAFGYRPPTPVDWMVCDILESPAKVARLAARWIAEGWCREAIFNLKLPMQRRRDEVERCRALVEEALDGIAHRLRIRQLYHDREEVTVHLSRTGKERARVLHSHRTGGKP